MTQRRGSAEAVAGRKGRPAEPSQRVTVTTMATEAAHDALHQQLCTLTPTWGQQTARSRRRRENILTISWETANAARDLILASGLPLTHHARHAICVETPSGYTLALTPMPTIELARIVAHAAITVDSQLRNGTPIDSNPRAYAPQRASRPRLRELPGRRRRPRARHRRDRETRPEAPGRPAVRRPHRHQPADRPARRAAARKQAADRQSEALTDVAGRGPLVLRNFHRTAPDVQSRAAADRS